jgi:hypothetical protein
MAVIVVAQENFIILSCHESSTSYNKQIALYIKPLSSDETVVDIDLFIHYCLLATTREDRKNNFILQKIKLSNNQPTFRFISKTSLSLQHKFFKIILRKQLKLLESR